MRSSIHSAPYLVLRRRLATARMEAGLTQEQLALRLGRPQSYVAKFETGDRRLDVVEFLDVCFSLDLDANALLAAVQDALPST